MCPSTRTPTLTLTATSDFRPAFEVLDADRDGKISYSDLQAFYSGFPDSAAADEDLIGTMMSVADSNRDGFVEYEEFEHVLGAVRDSRRIGAGVMEEVFRIMDKDGDGKLSHGDLKAFMVWAGLGDATDEDVAAMIRLGGGNEKSGVSYEGLLKILAVDFAV